MACTTILVGKKASYDGSTMIARTEDSQSGVFTPKEFLVVTPEDQPRHYQSVLSNFSIDLPDNPLRYTSVPDALGKDGIWGEAGINSANVAMSATETITTNARVLGADPLVKDGFGEEDMLTLVLPYIKTAREGVLRLGQLLETYGTYESNGIAFQTLKKFGGWKQLVVTIGLQDVFQTMPMLLTQTNLVSITMSLKIQTTILPHQTFEILLINITWI